MDAFQRAVVRHQHFVVALTPRRGEPAANSRRAAVYQQTLRPVATQQRLLTRGDVRDKPAGGVMAVYPRSSPFTTILNGRPMDRRTLSGRVGAGQRSDARRRLYDKRSCRGSVKRRSPRRGHNGTISHADDDDDVDDALGLAAGLCLEQRRPSTVT